MAVTKTEVVSVRVPPDVKAKDSGIVNDANDWAVETMANPRYPLELSL